MKNLKIVILQIFGICLNILDMIVRCNINMILKSSVDI